MLFLTGHCSTFCQAATRFTGKIGSPHAGEADFNLEFGIAFVMNIEVSCSFAVVEAHDSLLYQVSFGLLVKNMLREPAFSLYGLLFRAKNCSAV